VVWSWLKLEQVFNTVFTINILKYEGLNLNTITMKNIMKIKLQSRNFGLQGFFVCLFVCFLVLLGFELRASCLQGRHFTTWFTLPPNKRKILFGGKVSHLFFYKQPQWAHYAQQVYCTTLKMETTAGIHKVAQFWEVLLMA
jgi:hypothetical protein